MNAGSPDGVSLGDRVVLERGKVHVGQGSEQLGRARTLDGDQRRAQRCVIHGRVVTAQPFAERLDDRHSVRGVGHDHEAVVGDAIDDEVVDDPAVVRDDHAVVGSAGRRAGSDR